MSPAGTGLPAVTPIEQDHLPVARARETHPLRIRKRMAEDLADLAALNGGATREDMETLGWSRAQLVDHFRDAIKLAAADAPASDEYRPVKRIRRGGRAPTPRRLDAGFAATRERRLERALPVALMALCFALAASLTLAARPSLTLAGAIPKSHAGLFAPPPAKSVCTEPASRETRGLQFAGLP